MPLRKNSQIQWGMGLPTLEKARAKGKVNWPARTPGKELPCYTRVGMFIEPGFINCLFNLVPGALCWTHRGCA